MQFGAPEPVRARASTRDILLLLVAAAGMAFCVTLLFLGMRSVMDVGGACADGGPYVSAQPCPGGSALSMFLGIFGLFGFGALGFWAGASIGGAWVGLPLLAWPGLFLSLGWNFLQYGVAPPWGGGLEWGFLVPGILFVGMGAIPLLFAWGSRREFQGDDAASRVEATFGLPSTGGQSVRVSYGWHPEQRATSRAGALQTLAGDLQSSLAQRAADSTTGTDAAAATLAGLDGDLVDRLERLAHLRRSGDLTNEQFEVAKAALLATPNPDLGR